MFALEQPAHFCRRNYSRPNGPGPLQFSHLRRPRPPIPGHAILRRRSGQSEVMRQKHLGSLAPKKEARDPLESVLKAGRFIIEWSADVNEHRLWADKQKRAAVERQFEVIA